MQIDASDWETYAVCGSERPRYDIVHYQQEARGHRTLCTAYVNFDLAERAGESELAHPVFWPPRQVDTDGIEHMFRLRFRFLGDRSFREALDLVDGRPGGYEFSVMGAADASPHFLHEEL